MNFLRIYCEACTIPQFLMIEFSMESIKLECKQNPGEPSMYIATFYYNREIYVQEIPATLFSETEPLIKTKSKFKIQRESYKDELEAILNEQIYIVLHQVSPAKKAKKPIDNVSYSDLTFVPNSYWAQLPISEFFGDSEKDFLEVTKLLELQCNSTFSNQ